MSDMSTPMQGPPPAPQKKGVSAGWIVAIVLGVILLMALLIGGILVAALIPAVSQVRDAARRTMTMNNGRQMALGVHNYESVSGKIPTNRTQDDGTELQSWRAEILPFMDASNVADLIDPELAWDDPANQAAVNNVIPSFHSPRSADTDSPTTHFVAVKDPASIFSGEKISFAEIDSRDGADVTAIFLELPDSGIHWAEPRDVTISQAIDIIQNFPEPSGIIVVMADGAVNTVSQSTSADDIKKLFLLDNGAPSPSTLGR